MRRKPQQIKICYYDSPIGCLEICEDEIGVCRIGFPWTDSWVLNRKKIVVNGAEVQKVNQVFQGADLQVLQSEVRVLREKTSRIAEAIQQLQEYFEGKRKAFDLPLSFYGTDFQEDVWRALMRIPYGQTRSYRQIAEAVSRPKACRAVGMANHVNELLIVVPCHRVIGADGSLTGYGGGLDAKEKLLLLESRYLSGKE